MPPQILVLPEERQWSYAPDILTKHPESQTDTFILYVKSAILLSRVKTFNLRSTRRFYTEGTNVLSQEFDARNTTEFQELDAIISGFKHSFPVLYKSPVGSDIFDPYLYTAFTSVAL